MKSYRLSIRFLQALAVLSGLAVLAGLLLFPLKEGRAAQLSLFEVYSDPFILYLYAASAAFFAGVYQAFGLLGCLMRREALSAEAARKLRRIRYCALALGCALAAAGLYIRLFHHRADDPAGFLVLCAAAVLASLAAAAAAAVLEQLLQEALERIGRAQMSA